MGDLFTTFPLAALLALTPAVAGSPPPSPAGGETRTPLTPPSEPGARVTSESPLKEIGRVRVTTAFCRSSVENALAGISVLLDNDTLLNDSKATMRQLSENPSPVAKNNGIRKLLDGYITLREATLNGRRSIKQLKADSKSAPSEHQTKAIVALANAVDGALARQKVLADDVGRFALNLDSRERIMDPKVARSLDDSSRPGMTLVLPHTVAGAEGPTPARSYVSPTRELDDFAEGLKLLSGDEDAAAARIDPAFEKC